MVEPPPPIPILKMFEKRALIVEVIFTPLWV